MKTPGNTRIMHEAVARLNRATIQHARYDDALRRIMQEIEFPTDTKLLLVVGPTGVGKSRLRQSVENHVRKLVADKLIDSPGCVPVVSFEVPCVPSGHRFNWREFYETYMEHLDVPLTPTSTALAALPLARDGRGPEHALINALKHRRPVVSLLDEANHFAVVASGKVLLEQMTRIKSFANRSNVLHVCFGTYELAQMANLSGQLARRCDIVHFGRYRSETESAEDFSAFKKVVRSFQASLPVTHQLDLSSQAKYLHERSIGCVGVLKTWMTKALGNATAEGRKVITMADLNATELSIDRLQRMLSEARQGEGTLIESQEDLDLFRADLEQAGQNSPQTELGLEGGNKRTSNIAGRKPFEQVPYRHPTGGAFDGSLGRLAG